MWAWVAVQRGVLVRDASMLETLARVDTLVLDKTGTLTEGKPKLLGVHAAGFAPDTVLALAASLERASEHPLAAAIVRGAEEKKLALSHRKTSATSGRASAVRWTVMRFWRQREFLARGGRRWGAAAGIGRRASQPRSRRRMVGDRWQARWCARLATPSVLRVEALAGLRPRDWRW